MDLKEWYNKYQYYSGKYCQRCFGKCDIVNGGKSFGILYQYYLPKNYTTTAGYYSSKYKVEYFDGYGYNFYTGKYKYYQDSKNEPVTEEKPRFS